MCVIFWLSQSLLNTYTCIHSASKQHYTDIYTDIYYLSLDWSGIKLLFYPVFLKTFSSFLQTRGRRGYFSGNGGQADTICLTTCLVPSISSLHCSPFQSLAWTINSRVPIKMIGIFSSWEWTDGGNCDWMGGLVVLV